MSLPAISISAFARALVIPALFAVALPAAAKRKKAATPNRTEIAVFAVSRPADADPNLVRLFEEQLDRLLRDAYGAVLSGSALRSRLRADPSEAAEKCRRDAACLAKLGRRLKTETLFLATASPAGPGITVAAVVVSTLKGKIDGKASMAIAAPADVEAALKNAFSDLFHVPLPGDPGDELALPDLVPLTPANLSPTPPPLMPAPTPTDSSPGSGLAAEGLPAPPPGNGGPNSVPIEMALVAPADGPPVVTTTPHRAAQRSAWLTYTGLGILATGGVVAGLGAIPGRESVNTYNRIDRDGRNTTDQVTTDRLAREGTRDMRRANLLFMTGGAVAALGGVLVLLDRIVRSDEPAVTVTPAGVGLRF